MFNRMDNMRVPTKRKLREAKRHYACVAPDGWRRKAYIEELERQIKLLEAGCSDIYETCYGAELKLSNKGLTKLTQEKILLVKQEHPSGRTTIVSFDIPEDVRHLRNKLRNFLKKAGFTMAQRSVWTTKKDVSELMRLLIEDLGLTKWVNVFLV